MDTSEISKIQTKVDKELNTEWYPRCNPGTEKALSGKDKKSELSLEFG